MGLQQRRLQAYLGEERGDMLCRIAFSWTGVISRVSGIDPDQIAGERRDLVAG